MIYESTPRWLLSWTLAAGGVQRTRTVQKALSSLNWRVELGWPSGRLACVNPRQTSRHGLTSRGNTSNVPCVAARWSPSLDYILLSLLLLSLSFVTLPAASAPSFFISHLRSCPFRLLYFVSYLKLPSHLNSRQLLRLQTEIRAPYFVLSPTSAPVARDPSLQQILDSGDTLIGAAPEDRAAERPDMQYVRSLGGSVSKTWNSINPATLSGAIDVIVVEQEDGTARCSTGVRRLNTSRFTCLLPFPRPIWQIFFTPALRKEG